MARRIITPSGPLSRALRHRPANVEPYKLWQDAPLRCSSCPSRLRPVITCELYDQADHIVVGCATCIKCSRRYIFTRHLTPDEEKVPQEQGKPIRTKVATV